jgi:hypothetical protein
LETLLPAKLPFEIGDLVEFQHPDHRNDRGLILDVKSYEGGESIIIYQYTVYWFQGKKVVQWFHDRLDVHFFLVVEG